jgi:hypothetical protein
VSENDQAGITHNVTQEIPSGLICWARGESGPGIGGVKYLMLSING